MAELSTLPLGAGHLPLADLIDLYMRHYAGRDTTRVQRLTWWKQHLGVVALQDVTDDHIYSALEQLTAGPARYWAGTDADGKPIFKAKRRPPTPATRNRYQAAISAVLTWAIKKRIAPKNWMNPCRSVELLAENNQKVRFLDDGERQRLLGAVKASKWPRLYLLVLLGLTTGARKGELLGLR
ncbi:MAG TPA: hypothetical protein VFP68_09580 [Burkholderiaceae bacterium]|nr:hypothetical protein [Burkholderiaceae bacterium]